MTSRELARVFFRDMMGRIPGPSVVKALSDEFTRLENRGRNEVLDLVRSIHGAEAQRRIVEQLEERARVSSRDHVAQRGEDVAEQHGAAPAERG